MTTWKKIPFSKRRVLITKQFGPTWANQFPAAAHLAGHVSLTLDTLPSQSRASGGEWQDAAEVDEGLH